MKEKNSSLFDNEIKKEDIELEGLAEAMGGRVFVADLASHPGSNHHDTEKLFLTLSHIFQAEMLR